MPLMKLNASEKNEMHMKEWNASEGMKCLWRNEMPQMKWNASNEMECLLQKCNPSDKIK